MSHMEGECQKSWFSDDTMGVTARDTASSYERIHDQVCGDLTSLWR